MLNFIWTLCSWKATMIENPPSFFVFLEILTAQDNQAFRFWDQTDLYPAQMTQVWPSSSFLITPTILANDAFVYWPLKTQGPLLFFAMFLINGHFSYCNSPKILSLNIQCIVFHSFGAMIRMVQFTFQSLFTPPRCSIHSWLVIQRRMVSPAPDPVFQTCLLVAR